MSKTPVSILQEYCTKRSIVPQYDLIINGVGTHDPFFKFRLTVSDVVSFGEGKSKKEAKHEAASSSLRQLNITQQPIVQSILDDDIDDITSPYIGVLKENTVGDLVTLCTNKKLPDPVYSLVGEEGAPHAKTFTYQCRVSNLSEVAASRTKKQAKHLSAKKMIEKLGSFLGAVLDIDNKIKVEENSSERRKEEHDFVVKRYEKIKATLAGKTIKPNEDYKMTPSEYHNLKNNCFFQDNPSLIASLLNYERNNVNDPIDLLITLFKHDECDQIVFKKIEKRPGGYVMCSCEFSGITPSLVSYGAGNTFEEAKLDSAYELLSTLKCLMS